MSEKWFPVADSLSAASAQAFGALYPVFAEKITAVSRKPYLSAAEKRQMQDNLSRGAFDKKWGALPVAVWFALEAKGNDRNLIPWVNKGPDALLPLAQKYLTGESKKQLDAFIDQTSVNSN